MNEERAAAEEVCKLLGIAPPAEGSLRVETWRAILARLRQPPGAPALVDMPLLLKQSHQMTSRMAAAMYAMRDLVLSGGEPLEMLAAWHHHGLVYMGHKRRRYFAFWPEVADTNSGVIRRATMPEALALARMMRQRNAEQNRAAADKARAAADEVLRRAMQAPPTLQ